MSRVGATEKRQQLLAQNEQNLTLQVNLWPVSLNQYNNYVFVCSDKDEKVAGNKELTSMASLITAC